MTSFQKTINLLPGRPRRNVRFPFKVIGIGVITFFSAVSAWALLPTSHQTATIGNVFDISPSPTLLPTLRTPFAVSTTAAVSAVPTSPVLVQYYETQTGRVLGMDLRTRQPQIISDHRLAGFVRSIWARTHHRVVSIFTEPTGTVYRSYDYTNGVTSTIGTSVSTLAIAPNSNQVVYAESSGGTSLIFIAAFDGSAPRKILETRAESLELSWPNQDMIILVSQRPDRSGRDMSILGTDGTLRILFTDKENLEYTWSVNGNTLLFSFFDANGLTLRTLDMVSGQEAVVPLKTSARKCAWSTSAQEIICGVPVQQELPADIASQNVATRDQIVSFNRIIETSRVLWRGNGTPIFSIYDPILSDSFVTFINLLDHRLYALEL